MSRFSEVLGAAQKSTQKFGYPEIQPSEQPVVQPVDDSQSQQSASINTNLKTQLSKKTDIQPPGYPDIQQPEKLTIQTASKLKNQDKLAKRENPDYTQTTFRIPKKLSRQINRVLMDLADEGVEVDRSDLLEELGNAFIRLADEVGVVEALEQIKNLSIQIDE
ncbi:hypothetical protein IQ244_31535 [Nostoc sp. LEGE 06077]|uniref:hypothetical protein n=1 Tax=Nostoc sp. LEGE 06077 TaxID=915325 RepID=UPI0018822485|nr:hypothetical protein [Nostoc sp. LEGE 06077]MBE9210954.1 hypothetical protein [Nostoc sp. LEGE 06077]